MATVTYSGSSADVGADGSYSSTPGSGDTIIGAAGSLDLTGDMTGLTNIPAHVQWRFGTTGCLGKRMGTASTALKLVASNTARIDGNGYLQYVNLSAGTTTKKVAKLKVSNVATVVLTTGTIDEIELDNCGTVVIGSGIVYLKFRCTNGTKIVLDESNATKPTLVYLDATSASLDNRRGMATGSVVVTAGRINFTGTASNGDATSTLLATPTGTINGQSSGTLYNAEIMPGGNLLAQNSVQNQTWTIIRPWKGANVQRTGVGFTITITGEDAVP